jgi:hypothetical protein
MPSALFGAQARFGMSWEKADEIATHVIQVLGNK